MNGRIPSTRGTERSACTARARADQSIGAARGRRQSETLVARENQAKGMFEIDSVPDADEHGGDTVAGAQHRPDHFAAIDERASRAAVAPRLCVLAHETLLRATDGRLVERDAHVAGEPEAARVRDALPVAKHCVVGRPHACDRGQQGGQLAKREKSRYVWEFARTRGGLRFDDAGTRNRPHDGCSVTCPTAVGERAVGTNNGPEARSSASDDARSELSLELDRVCRIDGRTDRLALSHACRPGR